MRIFELERTQFLPASREEVFAFFRVPQNLQEITAPWLHLRVARKGVAELGEGARIEYSVRIRGIPLRWESRISAWDPPRGFVDEQLRGPYRSWVHRHGFEPVEGGTRVHDRVRYALLGGVIVDRLFVRGDLERIFDYRLGRLAERFGS